MKKKLLFLGALMLSSVGVFAQGWATATWTAPELPVSGANLDEVVGEEVFLYNKEAGGFFRGLGEGAAPHWGSEAGVAIEGADTIIFMPALAENLTVALPADAASKVEWMTTWDNATYLIRNKASHIKEPRWDEVWYGLNDFVTIWTDRQANATGNINFFWNIDKNADGTIAIKISPKVPYLANVDLYAELAIKDINGEDSIPPLFSQSGGNRLGVDTADPALVCCFEGYQKNGVEVPLSCDWTIVTAADYEGLDLETFKAEVARYAAALTLKAAIDNAEAKYANITGLDDAKAAYNNTASTLEQLEAGKASVTAAILAYQENQATPDNPADMTEAIENADFESGAETGWTYTKKGGNGPGYDDGFAAPNNTGKGFEFWNETVTSLSFDIYQKISGLPVGVYALSADITNSLNGQGQLNNGGRVYVYSTVMSSDTVTYLSAPVNIQSADAIVRGGTYTTLFTVAASTDSVQLGAKTIGTMDARWVVGDSFKLLYYGDSDAAYMKWRDQVVVTYPSLDDIIVKEVLEDGSKTYWLANNAYITAYTTAIDNANNAETREDIASTLDAIRPTLDSLKANIEAYKLYQEKVDVIAAEVAVSENVNDWVDVLISYVDGDALAPGEEVVEGYPYPNGNYPYIAENCQLTTQQVYDEIATVEEWHAKSFEEMAEGTDCTNMLNNASFAKGFEGWTNNSKGTTTNALGGVDGYTKVVENYGVSTLEIYQVVNNVPAGLYSISVQAFERLANFATGASNVVVFMNEFEGPIMNIVNDATPSASAVNKVNCFIDNGAGTAIGTWPIDSDVSGSYVPNSIEGASYAFSGKSATLVDEDGNQLLRYENRCYGLVGEDGVMKIGLTSHGKAVEWCLWANFKLRYEGQSVEALEPIIDAKITEIENYIAENDGAFTSVALDNMDTAIAATEQLADYQTAYDAYLALNKEFASLKKNQEVYSTAQAVGDELGVAMTNYENTASEEAIGLADAASTKYEEVSDMYTEELEALIEEMRYAIGSLKIPAEATTATDDNAVDMTSLIVNPDFSDRNNGWDTYTAGGNNQPLGDAWEFWMENASDVNFNIKQTLSALPAGKYSLTADLSNSYNGQTSKDNEGRSYLYAEIINGTDTTSYSTVVQPQTADASSRSLHEVIFEMPAPTLAVKVIIGWKTVGTMDARWSSCDNFALTYYGTESSKENSKDDITGVDGIESAEEVVPVAIYSISGARLAAPQKGINIIKMSDGSVKKVLVK